MKNYIDLIGRLGLGLFFAYQAYDLLDQIAVTKQLMTSFGLTWQQDLLLSGAAGFLSLGSLLLIIGYRSRLAAGLLLCYWIPVTFIVHAFWGVSGEEFRHEAEQFMHNFAIAGALFLILAHGTGKFAVRKLFATARV